MKFCGECGQSFVRRPGATPQERVNRFWLRYVFGAGLLAALAALAAMVLFAQESDTGPTLGEDTPRYERECTAELLAVGQEPGAEWDREWGSCVIRKATAEHPEAFD